MLARMLLLLKSLQRGGRKLKFSRGSLKKLVMTGITFRVGMHRDEDAELEKGAEGTRV